tara:strand:- start:354 stop:2264 length:1911 start_codon:yes stop_codon:yes gene_type:complete
MTNKLQMAMFPPVSEWLPPDTFPDITDAKEIAIDVETRDPDLKTHGPGWARGVGEVVGVAIAVDGWETYIPLRHLGGGNLDERVVSKWLKRVFECSADKIMHNAQYDAGWIRRMGFQINGRIIDTMITAGLLDENRFSYSLNALSYDYLGKVKSEKTLTEAAREFGLDPKAELWKLPAHFVGPYAETDAALTLELWRHFVTKLNTEDLWSVHKLETDLLPCLIDMTWNGVRVDIDRAERTKQELMVREKTLLRKVKKISGHNVEIWAAASIAKAFDAMSVSYPQTEKGNPSFTKTFLSEHPSDIAKLIVEAREINKTHSTFIDTILRHVAGDGRIHAHINQLRSDDGGTVSGRISMNNPNLQQVPARHAQLGPMIRSLFLPEEDQQWAAIDFSQQEPRILVHYAATYGKWKNEDGGLPGVQEFVEGYRNDPTMDFHTMVAEMADISRKQAKTINLAMMYGMGVNKLSQQLDISLDEAKDLTKQYHARVPFVKMLTQGVSRRLEDRKSSGSIRSLKGRKCRFDKWEPDTFQMHKAMSWDEAVAAHGPTTRLKRAMTYKALNRLIQASAADMCKQAMVNLHQKGVTPMIMVHDELDCSVSSLAEAQEIADVMVEALPLEVPSRCDIEIGPSWGEAVEP